MSERPTTLAGKRALVTGASRGIGRSIALALAEAGADVGVSARSEADLAEVAREIEARGQRGVVLPCDVTDAEAVNALASRAADTLGSIDILVNNAGAAASHKFLGHPDSLWHGMLAINLTSVYQVSKAFLPQLIERGGGRIINIASIASKSGAPYIAAYVASKHGVLGLTRALAAELVRYGITVNAICPAYVDTPMTDGAIETIVARTGMEAARARATLENMSPQQRLIEPDEIAALTVYLASEAARGINGQAINVDGGAVMW